MMKLWAIAPGGISFHSKSYVCESFCHWCCEKYEYSQYLFHLIQFIIQLIWNREVRNVSLGCTWLSRVEQFADVLQSSRWKKSCRIEVEKLVWD